MLKKTAVVAAIAILVVVVAPTLAAADGAPRFGFGANDPATSYNWGLLGAGWYQTWSMQSDYHLAGMDFYPMIGAYGDLWGTETLQSIQAEMARHPDNFPDGTVWIIGNELQYDTFSTANGVPLNPPRAITADEYAQKYKKYRDILKQINPTFQTAIAFVGTDTGSPITLQNVTDAYRARYGVKMPIDVYNLHLYAFGRSVDFQITFINVIFAYRQAMADMGDRDKPLIVSELGVLEGVYNETISDAYVLDFQRRAFDWLKAATSSDAGMPSDGNHLVQRWAWFALCSYSYGEPSKWQRTALFDYSTRQIRPLGQQYASYVESTSHFTLSLVKGWNLISIPLTFTDPSVATVLSPIAGKFDVVEKYDGCTRSWRSYTAAAPPNLNTLQNIDPGSGYWIHMTEAATVTLNGLPPATTTISLCSGWNLISCPTSHAHSISAPLVSLNGKYTDVTAFVASDPANPWRRYRPGSPSYVNNLPQLAPGLGYWIYMTDNATLVITE